MKILVTGGAGFLGSNLCKILVRNQCNEVIALDNLSTGKLDNLQPLFKYSNFSFIEHDIINPIDIQVDQIYNAACPASPPAYQKNPINTLKTNVIGVINMLDLATKYNATLLQFSTSEVYGDPNCNPQKETYWGNVNPNGIRSCYDEGKRCAETLCLDYHREFNTKVKIVRIFNTYGENMYYADGRVISNFINQALANQNITIYGTGTQTRSFCYVSDLLRGIIKFMNKEDDFTGPINLGNPEEYTINELAQTVIELTKSKSKILYCELPEDDPRQRCPDISLAKEYLDWHPMISLRQGLLYTIKYYQALS